MRPANSGPIYASGIYPALADAFRTHGYALAIHGSVMSDFDLIAVPWVEDASDPEIVIEDIESKFAIARWGADKAPAVRPHGRLAYCVHLSFGDCRLDISFTPRLSSVRSGEPNGARVHKD